MSFDDIIGLKKAVNHLLKSIKKGNISSSYIFTGKEGVGKKTTAIEFAKNINCTNRKDNLQSCEKCNSCRKINLKICPDLKIIEPEKGTLKIEQIREFRREINLKPFENSKKIYIFNNAEKMTDDAANCLLKTIEEPPEYAIIIVICSNIGSILPTIISRCQVLYFSTISSGEIEKAILKKNNLEISKAKLVSRIANGSIGNAFSILSDVEYFNRRDYLLNNVAEIIPGKIDCDIFNRKEKIFSDISRSKEILDMILLWYRDILIIKELNSEKYIVNNDKLKILKEKAKLYSKNTLIDILDYLLQIQEYLKRNANKNIIFESLVIKLSGVVY